ncbi:glucoamylase [Streptomyces sp. PAMC 26508]|nr:glucoamylase [Streptomyces sp. PAMC 26508]
MCHAPLAVPASDPSQRWSRRTGQPHPEIGRCAYCADTAVLHQRLIEHLAQRWQEPDEGIWEIRAARRHFVHSKVMAWVAIDRTIRLAEVGALALDPGPLVELRETIHREVCTEGFDPVRNTFTQSYGSLELDAATLLIPRVGFLPPDDRRVIGTVDAVRRELSTPDGLVRRYSTIGDHAGVDGLTGDEGTFVLCSFWLVDALALIGRMDEAHALFERLLTLRNDLGLLSEEYDPVQQRQLGNFPQAVQPHGPDPECPAPGAAGGTVLSSPRRGVGSGAPFPLTRVATEPQGPDVAARLAAPFH